MQATREACRRLTEQGGFIVLPAYEHQDEPIVAKMETLRSRLAKLVISKGVTDEEVLELSKRLDAIIVQLTKK